MKGFILAAGFGTRLLPHTNNRPKPLFTLGNQTLLELAVESLVLAGCDHILINTHHLHDQIQSFIKTLETPARIQLVHEPEILDTGGAIANIHPFLDDAPFFVINSDVVSSLDLKALYQFHVDAGALATLALHHHPVFNTVKVDPDGWIENFEDPLQGMAFTGIQVLSPAIFDYFPNQKKFSSIEVYKELCPQKQVKAYTVQNLFWRDIGTLSSYSETSLRWTAGRALGLKRDELDRLEITPLAGDGSDRKWFRACFESNCQEKRAIVLSDHGICSQPGDSLAQLRSFIHIGGHLLSRGIPVADILTHDEVSGIVALEDLGQTHLADRISILDNSEILSLYKRVIDQLIRFSQKGGDGFLPEWTCQTPTYSRELILEKECRYFTEAFLGNYLGLEVHFDDFREEYNHISDMALMCPVTGLMHRDMQSRNIMLHREEIYFIDYQSARTGPFQYDLASLLIDPYVTLDRHIQNQLLEYAVQKLGLDNPRREEFLETYRYCCLTRTLQILGAFGFLSRVKGKKGFEAHIPAAVESLKSILFQLNCGKLKKLADLANNL